MSPQSNLDSDAVPYIFFLFVGLIGIVGSFAYWNQTGAYMLETGGWRRATCEIIHSEVRSTGLSQTPYAFDVHYRYSFNGDRYEGSRYRLGSGRQGAVFENRAEVETLIRQYGEGQRVGCFVDPERPSESVLVRRPVLHAFAMVIPGSILLFSAIGLILTARWLPDPTKRGRLPKVILGTFLGIAAGVGVAAGTLLALEPALKWLDARDWQQVTAVIQRSEVSHGGGPISGGGPHWNLQYEFEVDGITYYGNDYSPLAPGTYGGLDSLAARYRPDDETTAWVDPANPDRSVLTRDIPLMKMLPAIGIILFVLLVAGGSVFSAARRVRRSG